MGSRAQAADTAGQLEPFMSARFFYLFFFTVRKGNAHVHTHYI